MENKLAVIIGAGPGVGMGVAEKFGSEGFKIALVGRTESKLQSLQEALQKKDIETHIFVGDASNAHNLNEAIGSITEQLGDVEVFVYNAAKIEKKEVLKTEWEEIQAAQNTNIGGAYNLLRDNLPYYLEKNRGKFLFTNGGFAHEGNPDYFSLSMGKAGLRNLVQATAKQNEKSRVHIGLVSINGFVNPSDDKYNPGSIAEQFWKLYDEEPDGYTVELEY